MLDVEHQRWSGRKYCRPDDVIKMDKNAQASLNLTEEDRHWVENWCRKVSARIEKRIGMQDPNDETVNELAVKMVWVQIAGNTPIAEQRGAQERISRMGMVPRYERDIRELIEMLDRTINIGWIEF